jgi:hypothetical protein
VDVLDVFVAGEHHDLHGQMQGCCPKYNSSASTSAVTALSATTARVTNAMRYSKQGKPMTGASYLLLMNYKDIDYALKPVRR